MKRKTIALLSAVLMVLSSCFVVSPNTIKADTEINSEVVRICTCNFNGIERTLTVTKNGKIYFKTGDADPVLIYSKVLDLGFDKYGTVWIYDTDKAIYWKNLDLEPDPPFFFRPISKPTSEYPSGYVDDVESLVFDDNNEFVIGYKTIGSDEVHPILTYDEIKDFLDIPDDFVPSVPTPAPTVTSTPTPTVSPAPVPTAHPTAVPTSSPKSTVAPISTKVSVKKQGSYTCIYSGNKVVSKFKLSKKGVLKFKGKKNRKYKAVKKAGFIKKSKNLIFLTKKGAVYTVSPKGKKKTILKKGAKKLIFKGKFVTKVKKKKGYINVAKK